MLLIAFVAFFALVVAWLVAPNGEVAPAKSEAAPAVAPALTTRGAAA